MTPLDNNTFSSLLRIFARNIEKLQFPVAIFPEFTKRNFIFYDLTKKFSKEAKNRDRKFMKLSHCGVVISEIFYHAFLAKFRESNGFTKKELLNGWFHEIFFL